MDSSYFDQTWCSGIACGHPSCWNSQRKIIRGQARVAVSSNLNSSRTFDNIPTQKIQSMNETLFGYDDWMGDVNREKSQAFVNYVKNRAKPSLKSCVTPPNSNNDRVSDSLRSPCSPATVLKPKVRQLEPQEILSFDDTDHQKTYVQNSKFCYIWVPNPSRLKRKKRLQSMDNNAEFLLAPVISRDVTKECFLQNNAEKENSFVAYSPIPKRPSMHTVRSNKSPIKGSPRHYTLPPVKSSSISQKMQEKRRPKSKSVASLMEMKPEVLADVLDHIEQGELPSPDNIDRVARSSKHMKKSPQDISLNSVFEQRKAPLHDPEDKLKQSEIHSSQPVFRLDNFQVSEPQTEPITDGQNHDLFLSQHLPLPPILSERTKDSSTLRDKSKQVTDGKSSVTRAHSTGISNISAQFDDQNFNVLPRKRKELYSNPKYGPPVNLFLGPVCGSLIHEETTSETPCSDDSRSMNVTVSTDRSTLYQEVLPGVKTFQPKILAISSDETKVLVVDQQSFPPSQSFIPIMPSETASDDQNDIYQEEIVEGTQDEPTPNADKDVMLSAFESLYETEEIAQINQSNSMSHIIEMDEEEEKEYTSYDDEESLKRRYHANNEERIVEIPIGEFENEDEPEEESDPVADTLPTDTSRLPFPPPPSPEPNNMKENADSDKNEMDYREQPNYGVEEEEVKEREHSIKEHDEHDQEGEIDNDMPNVENAKDDQEPEIEESHANDENQNPESTPMPDIAESNANDDKESEIEESQTNEENQDPKSTDMTTIKDSNVNDEIQEYQKPDIEESNANDEIQEYQKPDIEESNANDENQEHQEPEIEESNTNDENQDPESTDMPEIEESNANDENQEHQEPEIEELNTNDENQDPESTDMPEIEESNANDENQDIESNGRPDIQDSNANGEN